MNARDGVDQGAAVLLTSVGRARSLGIPPERWVFLHGCADASEPLMSEREDYTRCPAIRVMAERAFAMAGMGLDDVTAIDLYSCFPSAVEVACAELGLREDDPRGLTVTGGLPFFGGPGNNYSMHGIAEMVGRLRGKPDEVGLVTANGGYLSKHSMGLYSARPVEGEWRREDPADYQAALAARPKPAVAEEANGNATVVTYTVVFDDQAAPRLGIVVGRARRRPPIPRQHSAERSSAARLAGARGWSRRARPRRARRRRQRVPVVGEQLACSGRRVQAPPHEPPIHSTYATSTEPRPWRHNPEIIDLGHPDVFVDGVRHDAFAVLRRDYPVYWNEEPAGWGPGSGTSRATRTWSRCRATRDLLVGAGHQHHLPPVDGSQGGQRADRGHDHHGPAARTTPTARWRCRSSPRARSIGSKARIREVAREVVTAAAERGECDFMKDVAAPLPIAVLCEILGVPDSDRDKIFEWSNLLVGGIDPDLGVSQENVIPIYLQLFAYGQQLIEDRRRTPRGDLMTAIANARMEDGAPIREDLLNGFFLLMVIAGNETTRNSIAGGMEALIEHPDQHRRLRDDPSLLPTAVEEILRWVSPVLYMRRTATRPTEIRGVPIAEGDKVVMWYPAANRDAEVFAEPDRFDVGRDPNPHVAFGIGQHFCLGAQLARLQLRVMFSELLERLTRVELTGPVRRIRTNFLGAIKSMPVRCERSA